MNTEWMGQYRSIVEALIRFGNVYSQIFTVPGMIECSAELSGEELQVLEYILENEKLHLNMIETAERLSIPQSSFSKLVKRLTKKGLLEKYHSSNNRKNVIIRVSEYGREAYEEYVRNAIKGKWGKMFSTLSGIPMEYVDLFARILNDFSEDVLQRIAEKKEIEKTEDTLIRIE